MMTDKRTDVMKLTSSLGKLSNGLKLLSGDQKFKPNFHTEITLVSVDFSLLKYNRVKICDQLCIKYAAHNNGKYPLRFLGVTFD
jgi:hypothetical protein